MKAFILRISDQCAIFLRHRVLGIKLAVWFQVLALQLLVIQGRFLLGINLVIGIMLTEYCVGMFVDGNGKQILPGFVFVFLSVLGPFSLPTLAAIFLAYMAYEEFKPVARLILIVLGANLLVAGAMFLRSDPLGFVFLLIVLLGGAMIVVPLSVLGGVALAWLAKD